MGWISRSRTKGPFYLGYGDIARGTNYVDWSRVYYPNKSPYPDTSSPYAYPTASPWPQREYVHCLDELHPGPPYRTGGPFYLRRYKQTWNNESAELINGKYRYVGTFGIYRNLTDCIDVFNGFSPSASSYGAKAWNKFRPVKPKANLGQFLGELRDFPSMFKSYLLDLRGFSKDLWNGLSLRSLRDKRLLQGAGSDYLNYTFGWRPFIKDLLDFIELQKKIEKHIYWVRKNNGKWIRRHGNVEMPSSVTTTSNIGNSIAPTLAGYFYTNGRPSEATRVVTTTDHVWFEAKMKYYIQSLEVDTAKSVWSSKLRRKLWGFELTPALAWELMPWSWLQDWFLNVGDVLANFSNSLYDNLVAKYAYVMRNRRVTATVLQTQRYIVTQKYYPFAPAPPVTLTLSKIATAECKERDEGTPYGFGCDESSFTPRQLLILTALGLQQIPRL